MSQLSNKDLHSPFNSASIRKIKARMDAMKSRQGAAADLTDTFVSDVQGSIQDISFVSAADAAAGETISVDVLVNGTSVLVDEDPVVLNDTYDLEGKVVHLKFNNVAVQIGDVIQVVRDYTAGGGATPIGANVVTVEIG